MPKISWVPFRNTLLLVAFLVQVLTFLKHTNVSIFEGPTMRAPASLHSVARSAARRGEPGSTSEVAFVAGAPRLAQADRSPDMRGGLPSGFEAGAGHAASGSPSPTGSGGDGNLKKVPQGTPIPAPSGGTSEGHGASRPEPTESGSGESSGGGGSSAPPDGGGTPDSGGGSPSPAAEGGTPEASAHEERGESPSSEFATAEFAPSEPGGETAVTISYRSDQS